MRTLNEDQPQRCTVLSAAGDGSDVAASEDPILEDKGMKTTLLHVRRLAVAAAFLGLVFAPQGASAQSELDASEASAFMGSWSISFQSDFGAIEFPLELTDQGGKVAAKVGLPDFDGSGPGAPVDVTDLSRSGEGLVLNYEFDAQGQLVPVSLTLTPDGDGLAAVFDLADGALSIDGTGTRAN